MVLRIFTGLMGLIFCCFVASSAAAACGNNKLGTERVLEVDTSKYRQFMGHEKSFGLRHKEVVLTFDDGPLSGKTTRVLQALKKECVKATFFYVGKMARAHPRLVRRVVADGHTLAHHTHDHNRLPNYNNENISNHIDRGISTLQKIAYGDASSVPRIPFFRYPYLARSKRTDGILKQKGMIAFGANIDSRDWEHVSPDTVHNRIMGQLKRAGKGIVLMHDIQGRTAKMLPRLLRSLKNQGYKIVHMVPKGGATPVREELVVARAQKPTIAEDVSKHENKTQPIVVASLSSSVESKPKQKKKLDLGAVNLRNGLAGSTGAKSKKATKRTGRTGVQVVALRSEDTVVAPKIIKKLFKKPVRKTVKKKRRTQLALAKRKRRKKSSVSNGTWRLRTSQWIIN